ncbi:MAG: DUF1275 domain-containing protein [Sphingopyxis macrogoltabida]|uniref:DUF1275 domain-containing protein n=1 Tax=Sphingopyxis macrogoltabida TaxID=33050 RepID=A0A2W5KWQ6_SPHMC|nr:MAG: DUF1275 domain-containing protein [Sphingopyxis macrogoltabida]
MIRFDRSWQRLAVGVAVLAGLVDAIGFVESAGFFVSFMTGNSTRMAVGAAEWRDAALIAGGIIAVFVTGVVAGALLAARFRSVRTAAILGAVTLFLLVAAVLRFGGAGPGAIAALAFAMGVANAALEGEDGAAVGVTYMTGTLVQMGHKIANALRGEGDGRWHGHFWLWAGLVAGAIAGARILLWSPAAGYGVAILMAGGLAARAWWIVRQAR